MKLDDVKDKIPNNLYNSLLPDIEEFRPSQEKSIKAGLLERKNLLVCTPTASGKTLIAELAMVKSILENKGKAIYIVPLKALANEKFKDFKKRYGNYLRVALSIGDLDSTDQYLASYDLIVCTAEKLDSLIRPNNNVKRIVKRGSGYCSFCNYWKSRRIIRMVRC
jgi:helicase